MQTLLEEIVNILKEKNQTIATMESCTGGFIVNELTNESGSSEILKVSLVTYSNEYKIKFGVDPNVIDTYSVYSEETAIEMAKNVAKIAESTWGIGITGQLGRVDPANPGKNVDEAYYTVYNSMEDKIYNFKVEVDGSTRSEKKKQIAENIFQNLRNLI